MTYTALTCWIVIMRRLIVTIVLTGIATPAWGQISLTEQTTPVQATVGTTCAANAITVAAGTLVTVTIGTRESLSVATVIGTLNGVYVELVTNPAASRLSAIYYFIASGSGSETVTVTMSGTITAGVICGVQEWTPTGTVTANLTDVNTADNAAVTTHPHGSITTDATCGLIITAAAESGSTTETPGSGYTALADGGFRVWCQYDVTSVASVTTDGAFTTSGSIDTEAAIGSFNDSAIGGAVSSPGLSLVGVGPGQ